MEIVAEQRFYEQLEALYVSIESNVDVPDLRFFDLSSQYTTLLRCLLIVFFVRVVMFIFLTPSDCFRAIFIRVPVSGSRRCRLSPHAHFA